MTIYPLHQPPKSHHQRNTCLRSRITSILINHGSSSSSKPPSSYTPPMAHLFPPPFTKKKTRSNMFPGER
ncbi:unnamed protein product, partial [Brassica rapa subsp. trilocularis]